MKNVKQSIKKIFEMSGVVKIIPIIAKYHNKNKWFIGKAIKT